MRRSLDVFAQSAVVEVVVVVVSAVVVVVSAVVVVVVCGLVGRMGKLGRTTAVRRGQKQHGENEMDMAKTSGADIERAPAATCGSAATKSIVYL
ncbi:MAG: hypothetical protein ACJ8F7_02780 [Gemmataceae bacterium]